MVDGETYKKCMTPIDAFKIRHITDPRISPDGSKVAFTVSQLDLENNKNNKDIYVISSEGGEAINITMDGNSASPRWSPDGSNIAFISSTEGRSGIWVIDPLTQNKYFVTDYHPKNVRYVEVGEFLSWSPDGSLIVFVSMPKPKEKTKEIMVHTKIHYKAAKGFADMQRMHIFIVSPLGWEPAKQITFGDFDEHSICCSPDSKEIAFVSNRTGRDDYNFLSDVWSVSVETGEIRRITNTSGAAYNPSWSPDGGKIAYTARVRGDVCNDSNPEDPHVWVVNSDGTDAVDLTKDLDRRCWAPKWSCEAQKIIFSTDDWGSHKIYSVSLNGEIVKINRSTTGRWAVLTTALKADKIAYLSSDSTNPTEIFVSNIDGSMNHQVTCLNEKFSEEFAISEAEEFIYTSFDGKKIQGWVYKPPDFDPKRKYPMILHVHGGPHAMRGIPFNYSFQITSSRGYILAVINPRGSSGYGQEFSDGCVGDWGGGDYKDYMIGVDHLLSTREYIDPENLSVYGGSYGGFMTNWIITHTDRFKAAVSSASLSNLLSAYGTSSIPTWKEVDVCRGVPYDNIDKIWEQSPIKYIRNAKTPTLFIHGQDDHLCPIGQAEEMFLGLKMQGVETQLVRYFDEGHGIRKPKGRLDVQRRTLAWFDKYLKKSKL